jgi:hypothetical protein
VANFTTVRDLRGDALWIAGEAQTSASSYYARSLEYLNAVLIGLLAGGPLGALDLPAVDWWWLYKTRRGQMTIENAVNFDQSTTLTLTQNATAFTMSSPPDLPIVRWRLALLNDQDQIMRVFTHAGGSTTGQFDYPWGKATVVTNQWVAWQDHYELPFDFSRFTTPLKIGRYPYEIELCDMNALEQRYPRSRLWLGTPLAAAIVSDELDPVWSFAPADVNAGANTITRTKHGLRTGHGPVQIAATGGSLPGNVSANTNYWIIRVDANTIQLTTSFDNSINATPLDISSAGTAASYSVTNIVAPIALHFSHMLQDGPINAEFEYLTKVTEMADSTGLEEPPLPYQHRRLLSLGAAYLMLFDKVDAKYQQVGKMFESAWQAMAEEQYRQTTDNQNFGRIISRQREVSSKKFPLRSPSGFIYG